MQIKAVAEAHVVITNHGTASHHCYHTPYHNTNPISTLDHNTTYILSSRQCSPTMPQPINSSAYLSTLPLTLPLYHINTLSHPTFSPHLIFPVHLPTHYILGAFEGNLVYMRNGSLLIELCGNYENDDFKLFQNYSREFGVFYR